MTFQAVFDNVFTLLAEDTALIPGLLGPRVPQNMRLFRASPQVEQRLSTYEPNQPAEGWVIIEEPLSAQRVSRSQLTSNHEFITILFHIFGTTYAVGHDVLDLLDGYFHWEIEQQRDVQWADRILLFTRRATQLDKYDQNMKLYLKEVSYALELALEESAV